MNNNMLLNQIKLRSESIIPDEKLSPEGIENSLSNVKKSSGKQISFAAVSFVLIICLISVSFFTTFNFWKISFDPKNITPKSTAPPAFVPSVPIPKSNYDTVFKAVSGIKQKYGQNDTIINDLDIGTGFSEKNGQAYSGAPAAASDSLRAELSSDEEFSGTNTQVSGVDEADIVKADGNYIYTLSGEHLLIVEAKNGDLTKMSDISLDFSYSEMYISGDTLAVLEQSYEDLIAYGGKLYEEDRSYAHGPFTTKTALHFYDISDRANPLETHTLAQDGGYISSRLVNNTIYLATNSYVYDLENIDKKEPRTFVPSTYADEKQACVESSGIYIGSYVDSVNYVNFSSIDLDDTSKFYCTKSILGNGSNVYCNDTSFYVVSDSYDYENDTYSTQLFKYAIDGPDVMMLAETKVKGNILNQFSMDEYNGYFRIVTQSYSSDYHPETNLYILDPELNLTGKLERLAKNENVKSVRFDGDIGYFVTFRNTDPLFTVDLSDTGNPVILNELKIPGFSEYLHPFGKNLLLGFGSDADVDSGGVTGLKLSMFDVSDKTDVREISTCVFEQNTDNQYVSSDAQYNHKAIFADSSKNLVGLMYNRYSYVTGVQNNYYVIFKYDNNTFTETAKINLGQLKSSARGLYIGDYFYVVYYRTICVLSLNDFELAEKVIF